MSKESKKYYLSEFTLENDENDIVFNILDIDTDNLKIICNVKKDGKFFIQDFDLIYDEKGELYFEYLNGDYQGMYQTPRKDADIYCNKVLQPEKIYIEDFED